VLHAYCGFPGGRSVSHYDQLTVGQDGGAVGAILLLFGGVTTVVVLGFWLQAASFGVVVIGTILVAIRPR
jgi:hypothetical protein